MVAIMTRYVAHAIDTEPRLSANLLLIVARAPIPGETKTRLGATIGMEQAAALHCAFLSDLAQRFTPISPGEAGYQLGWAFTPKSHDFCNDLCHIAPGSVRDGVRFVAQDGEAFGDRLTSLLAWSAQSGYERTILMASDSPHLSINVATCGFALLEEHQLIIGRVADGGYYLVGLEGFNDLLSHVPMSTSDAAEALVAYGRSLGLRVGELEPDFDIDLESDLERLVSLLEQDPTAAPSTRMCLKRLGLFG
jgi:uncharacterized protein